jgi:hypothetical protein
MTIPPEVCVLEQWERFDHLGEPEPVDDQIAGWDYDSHMEFGRSIELRPREAVESIGLTKSAADLSVIVTAETGPTSYRWLVARTDVPGTSEWKHDIRFSIESAHLAQRLSLVTEVVLAKQIPDPGRFVPNRFGSRLFRDAKIIQLEGSLGRFPMEMIDFRKGLPFLQAPDALWYLDWDPSRPESQFLGTVLLYVNSAHPEVSNLVQAAEPTILSILRCDVIRAMSQAMLQNEEFLASYADYGTDTVGGQVREWLLMAFGDQKPVLLRSKLESAPGRFEAQLQSVFS